ncbi:MAG: type 4a pilus biogenesis protein PilO [Desulfurivibrionaceae bacterium]
MKEQITKIKQAYGSFLDNKLTRLSKQQKIGILAGSLLVPLLLFFFLIYSPKSKDIEKLENNIQSLKGEIQKVEAIANRIDEHRAEKQEVELRLKAASLLLPKEKEIPNLLTDISEQGTSSGLEFISFTPRPERPEQFYAVIPIAININGSYHQIGTFLDRISKLNRIVTVNNISLGGAKASGNEMLLTANLELVTYRFVNAPQ